MGVSGGVCEFFFGISQLSKNFPKSPFSGRFMRVVRKCFKNTPSAPIFFQNLTFSEFFCNRTPTPPPSHPPTEPILGNCTQPLPAPNEMSTCLVLGKLEASKINLVGVWIRDQGSRRQLVDGCQNKEQIYKKYQIFANRLAKQIKSIFEDLKTLILQIELLYFKDYCNFAR